MDPHQSRHSNGLNRPDMKPDDEHSFFNTRLELDALRAMLNLPPIYAPQPDATTPSQPDST